MTFDLLVRELGELLNLDDFQAVDGCAHLVSETGTVTFLDVSETDCILMTTKLGTCPVEDSSRLLRAMMSANFMFRGTRGGTLGLDESTGELTLVRFDRLELLDGSSYLERVQDFVAVMMKWREAIAEYASERDDGEPTPEESQNFLPDGMIRI